MKKILAFLEANPVFQLATVEGDQPRVRPFGFHMVEDGRIYFITGEAKDVCRQLKANPKFELGVCDSEGKWLRLRGKAVFDNRADLLEKAFSLMPMLKEIYGAAGGPKAALFYADKAEAVLADMQGNVETIKL
jgi:Uncharacterized conserved protein